MQLILDIKLRLLALFRFFDWCMFVERRP